MDNLDKLVTGSREYWHERNIIDLNAQHQRDMEHDINCTCKLTTVTYKILNLSNFPATQ